ncbi:phosphoribosylanthranilate isomerase [Sphingomonas nostoxanthinifaciens]|uniref:phosphoribosylanthranilate isomerase n=1 Tax=Sphingomonas nostoxanthinifaciens TaxID=2872652 RepID=UPI001CC218A0|nr:phosphoribosylanthranilate isomerase [Sphingomonas nostoxanthinifaciens]UAK23900.1 phosphoribosylanthranilate isomerase [Sphingomonas nostoxanthinifaciens]
MPTVRSKICGLSTADAIDAAIGGGAAWVGFVFFPKSPRDVNADAVAGLTARVPAHIGRVGVFVDPDDALVAEAARAGLTALQLHGDESPERLAALRRHGLELWKAIPVRTRADLDAAKRYQGVADRILYDAKTPPGTLPGGMGMRFDWRLLDGFDHPLPWLLSGGLDAGNLSEAVGITGARAIDVSSGVERAPGVKDVDKVSAFLQAAARL